jgi:hypothetical protein
MATAQGKDPEHPMKMKSTIDKKALSRDNGSRGDTSASSRRSQGVEIGLIPETAQPLLNLDSLRSHPSSFSDQGVLRSNMWSCAFCKHDNLNTVIRCLNSACRRHKFSDTYERAQEENKYDDEDERSGLVQSAARSNSRSLLRYRKRGTDEDSDSKPVDNSSTISETRSLLGDGDSDTSSVELAPLISSSLPPVFPVPNVGSHLSTPATTTCVAKSKNVETSKVDVKGDVVDNDGVTLLVDFAATTNTSVVELIASTPQGTSDLGIPETHATPDVRKSLLLRPILQPNVSVPLLPPPLERSALNIALPKVIFNTSPNSTRGNKIKTTRHRARLALKEEEVSGDSKTDRKRSDLPRSRQHTRDQAVNISKSTYVSGVDEKSRATPVNHEESHQNIDIQCKPELRCAYGTDCRHIESGCPLNHDHQASCRKGRSCTHMNVCEFFHTRCHFLAKERIFLPENGFSLPKGERFSNLQEAAHLHPIGVQSISDAKFCTKLGFAAQLFPGSHNPHSHAALIRTMVVRLAITTAYRENHRVFLAPQDFGTRVAPIVKELNLVTDARVEPMYVVQLNDEIVSKDVRRLRRMPYLRSTPKTISDTTCVIYVDQYEGVSPIHVNHVKKRMKSGVHILALFIMNTFRGPMGVDGGQAYRERSGESHGLARQLTCSSDSLTRSYVNPRVSWITDNSWIPVPPSIPVTNTTGVSTSPSAGPSSQVTVNFDSFMAIEDAIVLNGKHLFEVRWTSHRPLDPQPAELNRAGEFTEEIELNKRIFIHRPFMNPWDHEYPFGLGKRTFIVHSDIYHKHVGGLASKPYSMISDLTLKAAVHNDFINDSTFTTFKSRGRDWSGVSETIEEDTKLALLFARKHLDYRNLEYAMDATGWEIGEMRRISNMALDSFGHIFSMKVFLPLMMMLFAFWFSSLAFRHTDVDIDGAILDQSLNQKIIGELRLYTLIIVGVLGILESNMFRGFRDNGLTWTNVYVLSLIMHFVHFLYLPGLDSDHHVNLYWLKIPIWTLGFLSQFIVSYVAISNPVFHGIWNVIWAVLSPAISLPARFMQANVGFLVIFLRLINLKGTHSWDVFQRLFNNEQYYAAQDVIGSSFMPLGSGLRSSHPHQTLHLDQPSDPKAKLELKPKPYRDILPPLDPRRVRIWPILGHTGLLCTPAAGMNSAYYALAIRNMRLTPESTDPDIWRDVTFQFCSFIEKRLDGLTFVPRSLRDWANSYSESWKRKEIHDFLDRLEIGLEEVPTADMMDYDPFLLEQILKFLSVSPNNTFAKLDECLKLKRTADGATGMKPRAIQAVKLRVQAYIQPYVLTCSDNFKFVIDEPFEISLNGSTRIFKFRYASGLLPNELTEWYIQAEEDAAKGYVSSIVCGDDSLTIMQTAKGIEYIELDYSHFDQSQKEVQNQSELSVLRSLGCPSSVCEILRKICTVPARCKKRSNRVPFQIHFTPSGPNRVTGAPNTSLSNSTNNLLGIIIASFYDFEKAGWDIVGFNAKQVRRSHITETTFLRGTWWPHKDSVYRWGLLPSAIIKLTKVQVNLNTFAKVNRFAMGMALGMGSVPSCMPIIGAYKHRVLQICGSKDVSILKSKFRPYSELTHSVDRDFVMNWMCERYGTTVSEILCLERKISEIPSFPYFIGDNLFVKLMKDY